MIDTYSHIALVILVYMLIVFLIAQIKKDNSIVDIAWGLGFIVATLCSLRRVEEYTIASIVVTALVLVWGLRLSYYIYRRNKGKGEDPRYAAWRRDWGKWVVPRAFFQVFMLQGLILFIIVSPVIAIHHGIVTDIYGWLIAGAVIWIVGFLFETIGDAQLKQFIADPANKGRLMMKGLWQYTRHPNYFGEALMWWGIWVMAIPSTIGLWTIASPLLLTYLLRFVSGVTMTEERWKNKPDFAVYKKRTNAFIPWFPKKYE